MKVRCTLVAAGLVGVLAGPVLAGGAADAPYRPSFDVSDGRPNTVRLVRPAQHHPEVAVSRTLAAQPVHPHLVEVRLNRATITYVDPARRLDGQAGLDSGHPLVRAQRLARQLEGITTRDLAALSNAELAVKRPAAKANRVRVIRPSGAAGHPSHRVRPAAAAPVPAGEPAPRRHEPPRDLVPDAPRHRPAPPRQLASMQ